MAMTPMELDIGDLGVQGLKEACVFMGEDGKWDIRANEKDLTKRFHDVYTAVKTTGGGWDPKGIQVSVGSHTVSNFTIMYAVGQLPKKTNITVRYEFGVANPLSFGVGDTPTDIKQWYPDPESIEPTF
jgi:hypothetical protein